MAQIGATQLIMGFLSLQEYQVDHIQPFEGAKLIKLERNYLPPSMTGVGYVLSQVQSFFIIFDDDFDGQAVVQKTYWGDETEHIYNMVKQNAIPGMKYKGSNGFFIHLNSLGYLLVELQVLNGSKCITVSRECVYNKAYILYE